MGNNSGKLNLGVVGFDFTPNGGGVTVLGGRLGVSDQGMSAGPNFAFGGEINGKGAHAGAGAAATIGAGGLGFRANANATAGDQSAVSQFKADQNGCKVYGGLSVVERRAWEAFERAEAEVPHKEQVEARDRGQFCAAQSAKNQSSTAYESAKAKQQQAEENERRCGAAKRIARERYDKAMMSLMNTDEIDLFPESTKKAELENRHNQVSLCQLNLKAEDTNYKKAKDALAAASAETPKCHAAKQKCEEDYAKKSIEWRRSSADLKQAQSNLEKARKEKDRTLQKASGISSRIQEARSS